MPNPVAHALLGLATVVLLQASTAGQGGQAFQENEVEARGGNQITTAPGGPVPRMADGKPDLSGNWLHRSDGGFPTNNIEEHPPSFLRGGGKAIVVDPPDGKLPYRPEALKERDRRRLPENSYDDPEGHCFLSGVPRIMYFESQILQTPTSVVLLHEYIHAYRVIHLGTRKHLPDGIRLWQGDSIGWWEGDTLVIETTNNNGKTWLDLSGNMLSDATRVLERVTMADSNTIRYTATVDDPKVYARPWTIALRLIRESPDEYGMLEEACHEDNQDLAHTRAVQEAARRSRPQ